MGLRGAELDQTNIQNMAAKHGFDKSDREVLQALAFGFGQTTTEQVNEQGQLWSGLF